MYPRIIKTSIAIIFILFNGIAIAQNNSLSMKVITAGEGDLYTNFTLIMGEKEMVLVDAPFSRSGAHRLVADIIETGKELTTVYVTHDHPDHFFSMEVITEAFPNVRVIAPPQVVEDIWASIPLKIKRWSPLLGANGPRYPTAPTAMEQDYFELEGHRLEVLGPMRGDHKNATALYIPDLKALIAGDIVFQDVHVWLGETTEADRYEWIKVLEELAEIDLDVLVSGHKSPGQADSLEALAYTKNYIVDFIEQANKLETSEQLIMKMRELYPNSLDALDDFILLESAKVGVGENDPWQE